MQRTSEHQPNHPNLSWGRSFLVALVFVTLASVLFWLDSYRSYRADVTVLVIERTSGMGTAEEIAYNLRDIANTLAFHERNLARNESLMDPYEGYAPDQRKSLWNDKIQTKKSRDGSTLVISATDESQAEAIELAREASETLFGMAGFYYDVKRDIDLRIIEGPVVNTVIAAPVRLVLVSLLTGFVVTAVFFGLLSLVPGFFLLRRSVIGRTRNVSRSHGAFQIGDSVPWIDPKKFIPEKPSQLTFENHITEKKPARFSEVKPRGGVSAPAPANLPIADDEPVVAEIAGENPPEAIKKESGSDNEVDIFPEQPTEPTIEEYKKRLNELLSGGK